MVFNIPNNPTHIAEQSPKKGHRKALIALISFVFLVVLGFVSMFMYYLWIETQGSPAQRALLNEQFVNGITLLPGLASSKVEIVKTPIQSLIHPYSPIFGNNSAPITVVAFIDFECPFSRAAYQDFETIRDRYASAIKIIFKHFPIDTINPHAVQASLAAACAQDQGKFWDYYQALFESQDLTDATLTKVAATVGLNVSVFSQCLGNQIHMKDIQQDLQDGITVGVRGTPTYMVNQQLIEGVRTLGEWESVILDALKQSK